MTQIAFINTWQWFGVGLPFDARESLGSKVKPLGDFLWQRIARLESDAGHLDFKGPCELTLQQGEGGYSQLGEGQWHRRKEAVVELLKQDLFVPPTRYVVQESAIAHGGLLDVVLKSTVHHEISQSSGDVLLSTVDDAFCGVDHKDDMRDTSICQIFARLQR